MLYGDCWDICTLGEEGFIFLSLDSSVADLASKLAPVESFTSIPTEYSCPGPASTAQEYKASYLLCLVSSHN